MTKQSHAQGKVKKSKVHHKVTDKMGKVLTEHVYHEEEPHNAINFEGAII